MLQWMGGSRRKVATSRKSTQKRQKQYFEQRKRQLQQKAGLESSVDHKDYRSLDVVSLLNLSTSSQEHNCVSENGRQDLEVNASTVKYHMTKGVPQIVINTQAFENHVEVKEAGTRSGYQVENIYPKNTSVTAPNSIHNVSKGGNCKSDLWTPTSEQPTSVFDLLADEGLSVNLEGSPIREAHVAFSVEGLGKVGTKTPVCSPQPQRIFQYTGSSPQKAARRHNSRNFDYLLDDLELEADTMMQDLRMPCSGSYSDFPMGIKNSCSYQKHKYSTVNDYAPFISCGNETKNSFDDSKSFYGIGKHNDYMWDVRSRFLDDEFLNENELSKTGPCQMEGIGFLKHGNREMENNAIAGSHLENNRDPLKATDTYKILGSPFPKHQTSENNSDFMTYKRTGYPVVGRDFDFQEVKSEPDFSHNEDARDDLSLLSEESCSSSAVRDEVTNRSAPDLVARKWRRICKNAFGSHMEIYGMKNIDAKRSQSYIEVDIEEGTCTCESGKCTRIPTATPSRSKQLHNFDSPFQDIFGMKGSCSFDQGYTSVDKISGSMSFCQNSDQRVPPLGSKLEMEDPLSQFPFHELHTNAKSPFNGVSCGESIKCPPFDHSKSGDMLPGSFHFAGSHGGKLFPDSSEQESISKDKEYKSKSQVVNHEKFEPAKQNCSWNNCMISENNEAMDASNSADKILEIKEAEDGTWELQNSLETAYSSEHAEVSSVKISGKLESSVDTKECNDEAKIHLPSQKGSEDLSAGIDDAGPDQRKIVSKRKGDRVNSSSPVMMLESYVLKLLCVQKLLKDEQDTAKELSYIHKC